MRFFSLFLLLLFSGTSVMAHDGEGSYCRFIPNRGQFHPAARYQGKINHGNLILEDKAFTFHFMDNSILAKAHMGADVKAEELIYKGHAYKVNFIGAGNAQLSSEEQSPEYYNYYRGNNPARWASKVHAYEKVNYKGLYPGIDMSVYTSEGRLKYDFQVSPGADAGMIVQEYIGLENLKLVKGNLEIHTDVIDITEQAPVAWQMVNGKKKNVPVEFKLEGNKITYHFPKGYDHTQTLIIDPVLIFGSSSGSFADNFGMTATYSSQGNLFTGGTAFDVGYPVTLGAYMTSPNVNGSTSGITDVVITKYSPNGTSLVYSTYLGGGDGTQGAETVHSLICNANDELFLMGVTSSSDFPTTPGAFDNTFNGGSYVYFPQNGTLFNSGTDLYVTKFNFDGTALLASTYIGGSANDGINCNNNTSLYDSLQKNYGDQFRGEIMVDRNGNCYVASVTKSSNFPTANAIQNTLNGDQDAAIFKFDPNLTSLQWSTFLGGSNKDAAYSIKVDTNFVTYVCGGTSSTNFPTTVGTYSPTAPGGKADGYLVTISPSGTSILAGTYLGTNNYDQTYFLEIDRYKDVYVVGQTLGTSSFPVVNVGYTNANSGQFVTKFDHNLTAIQYSTTFGNGNNNINISPAAFMVDVCGNVYVSGWGANILQAVPLNGMPTTANAFQPTNGDGFNFYLIVFSRNIGSLLYATYFGGPLSHEHVDGGTSRFSQDGIVYQSVCAGCWGNDDFPTTPGAWSQVNNSSFCNNGVFKFDFEIEPVADFVTDQLEGCAPLTIHFDNTSPLYSSYVWDFGNGDTTSTNPDPIVTFDTAGTYTVYLVVQDSICLLLDTAEKVITVYPPLQLSATDSVICSPSPVVLTATSFGTVNNYFWSSNGNFTDTLNSPSTDSTLLVNISGDTTFFVNVSNTWCSYTDTVIVHIPQLDITISSIAGLCTGDSAFISVTNNTPQDPLNFNWGPDSLIISGDGTNTVLVSPDYNNWITVTGTTLQGCTVSDSTFIPVSGPPTGLLNATADDYTIMIGQSTVLHASPNGYTYSWSPSSTLDNPNIQHPTATPDVTTIYTVTVSNNGCSLTDTVMVKVLEFVCGEPNIYVPNAFTPNGDGENDLLFVRGNNITKLLFRVFDRWGELVFETTNQSIGWDGKFKDRDCDPAVFVWYVEATCEGGDEYFQKGNVTLIR
ncbi:MAG: gliding motility-associated C-terminal domain-containing protein [Flavobacteriales bacterium]|nr:gliding motility-associated C-terminal domain-containing protein [Flavobacteriales bacterium]